MKIFVSIIFFVSAVRWVCCDMTLNRFVQEDVDIRCGYSDTPDIQSAYLMKMGISRNVSLIETHKKDETVTKGRYSLYHNSKEEAITVTIHNLSTEDAGIYRCGVATYDSGGLLFDPVRLEVEHAQPTFKTPLLTGGTAAPSTSTGHLTFVFLRLVAVALCFGLLYLAFIIMKSRVKGGKVSRPTHVNSRNTEEESSV